MLKSRFVHRLTSFSAFGFYAGLNVVALVLIFLFLPETKQRTLEELDYVFALPTSKFGAYQVNHALPYFIKRWVFFNRKATLKPLYQEANVKRHTEETQRVPSDRVPSDNEVKA